MHEGNWVEIWNTHKVPKVFYKRYISSKNAHYPSIHCEKITLSRSNFLKCGLTFVREGNSFKLQPWGKFYSWQVLPFGLFVCLFVYFEGEGGRGCLSQPKVQGNDRNDSFSREAGAHSHPILSQVSCVKITTKFLKPPFFYAIYLLSLLNMNRI